MHQNKRVKENNLFWGKTNRTVIQLFRYVFVGGIAFLVDFGMLYVLTEFVGLFYLTSATLSFIFGLITNYLISTFWVFGASRLDNRFIEFLIFSIIGVIGLVLNSIIMYLSVSQLGINYLVSKVISTIIVFSWNFWGRKLILFNTNQS